MNNAEDADISKATFDVIDLKGDLNNSQLTVNEESELLISGAQTNGLTVNVNNAEGNLATGDGTLKLDLAVDIPDGKALTIGKEVGTLILNQDTADVAIASLTTDASAAPTVVITGDKNVEITSWVNINEQVLTAGNLEGDLTVALTNSDGNTATAGATVISGVGNDNITIGKGNTDVEYTVSYKYEWKRVTVNIPAAI